MIEIEIGTVGFENVDGLKGVSKGYFLKRF